MHSSGPAGDDATELQTLVADADAAGVLAPGAQLGPYVIRRVLGEGGMGCVYLAEQLQPVRREVALKLIREQVSSPLARAYFDVERQALAQMQHPAIAQVFDAGTTAHGHPYLAMEVVEGSPLTRYCRETRLGLAERLALFARVCHGVQHAHQKGIIHRDLKPSNVLVRVVDGEPVPKIIDFGIAIGGVASGGNVAAHATASDQAGTAVYMSPEQAIRQPRGIDTRSDVYSLGVMLYEVLTDADAAALTSIVHDSRRAPHETLLAAIDSNADASASPTPDAFLEAARRLPHELRAILRMALAADRADRYDSAAALADDLERYRQKRPVKALPQTRWYLTRTFIARHRIGLAAASLAALALVAGIALALAGLAQARVEAAKSTQVSEFVRGILGGIDPDRAKGMDTKLMRMVLDSAAERAGRELAGQPDVRAEIEYTIADSYSSLGEFALARDHYDDAISAARKAGLPAAKIGMIAARRALGINAGGKPQDALAAARDAQAQLATLPEGDGERLKAETWLGLIERDAGKLEDARARLARVIAQHEAAGDADEPDALDARRELAITEFIGGRYDEAQALLQPLIATYARRYGEEDTHTLGARVTLAVLNNERENYPESERLLAPLLPMVERTYGLDHPRTLVVIMNLGSAIRFQKRYAEARPYYERALELARKLYGPTAPRTLMAEGNMSLMLRDAGDLVAAERHARFVTDNAEAAFGDNPYRAAMHRGLATVLVRAGKYADAESELQRAWTIFLDAPGYGAAHPRSQEAVDTFIELYDAWGKPAAAAEWRARKTPATAASVD